MIQAMVKKLNGKRLIGKFFWYSWRNCHVSNGYPVPLRINQLWFFAG